VSERRHPSRRRFALAVFFTGIVVEILLIAIGIAYLVVPGRLPSALLLAAWCTLGTLYIGAIAAILFAAGRSPESDEPPEMLELSLAPRVIAIIATAVVSVIGVAVTVQHIFFTPADDFDVIVRVVGIAAMLLAWALFHWGFAQLYLQLYYREDEPPLRFPGTAAPGILEFAYFSYTIAVSFAASDVEVRDRRMRLRVLVHAVIGFFFNALIIVTAISALSEIGSLLR
jgi:uncharacterized membrane protein